jgi:hypothetical protein
MAAAPVARDELELEAADLSDGGPPPQRVSRAAALSRNRWRIPLLLTLAATLAVVVALAVSNHRHTARRQEDGARDDAASGSRRVDFAWAEIDVEDLGLVTSGGAAMRRKRASARSACS